MHRYNQSFGCMMKMFVPGARGVFSDESYIIDQEALFKVQDREAKRNFICHLRKS
jgi:hypothetical protein